MTYSHMFVIAFTVENEDRHGDNVTQAQYRAALEKRMADLDRHQEWDEAVGLEDTYAIQEGAGQRRVGAG